METIKAIAMLCSMVGGGTSSSVIDAHQTKCHAFYASCLKGKKAAVTSVLDCMAKRYNDGLDSKKMKR